MKSAAFEAIHGIRGDASVRLHKLWATLLTLCIFSFSGLSASAETPLTANENFVSESTETLDGVFCRLWRTEAKSKACLVCIHGLGLNSGSYAEFGHRLAKEGFLVYAIDVRGFGVLAKEEAKPKIDLSGTLKDITSVLATLHDRHTDIPFFVIGESMGGALAVRTTAANPGLVDGLISSVPANERFQQKKTNLKVALRLIMKPSAPFAIGEKLVNQATTDNELRERWQNDPLNRLTLSANELLSFQRFMNENHDYARRIVDVPVLILQGCEDRLVKPEGTIDLFNEVGTKDRFLVLVGSAEHLMLQKGQFTEKLIATILGWLNTHL